MSKQWESRNAHPMRLLLLLLLLALTIALPPGRTEAASEVLTKYLEQNNFDIDAPMRVMKHTGCSGIRGRGDGLLPPL